MKEYRYKFFEILEQKKLQKGEKIYLYFLHRYKYQKAELLIRNNKPFIKIDDNIKAIFSNINPDKIISTLYPQYKEKWIEAYKLVKSLIEHNEPLQLNKAAQVIFGPYFNPNRKSQSYNIYVSFFLRLDEVEDLINPNELRRYEKIIINEIIFYTIDDIAKSIKYQKIKSSDNYDNITKSYSENEYVRIKKISLSNFVNFSDTELEFSPSINLIIGKNNTGKTNLLKLLYCIVKSLEIYIKQKKLYDRSYKFILSQKIQEVFQSSKENIGTIVSKNSTDNLKIELTLNFLEEEEKIKFSFGRQTRKEIADVKEISELFIEEETDFNTIFVPSKEILSIHEVIKKSFKEFIKGFDATYNDLIELISPFIATNGISRELLNIIEDIQNEIISGKIEYDSEEKEFIFKNKKGQKFEMTMTAEGVKQVGIIPVLINTGELHSGSIIFLDEPDNNLNPVTINKFVKILIDLAKAGVQIFISSHNYFILKRLHIFAKQLKHIDFRVYSLIDYNDTNKIDIEVKDLKFGLPKYNPIVDEALRMFDDDIKTDLTL